MKAITRLLLVAALAGLALPAWAGDAGFGPLDDVDLDGRTVTVRGRVLSVSSRSHLRDEDGAALTLARLEDSVGGRVSYRLVGGARPVVERLTLEDPDSDDAH